MKRRWNMCARADDTNNLLRIFIWSFGLSLDSFIGFSQRVQYTRVLPVNMDICVFLWEYDGLLGRHIVWTIWLGFTIRQTMRI